MKNRRTLGYVIEFCVGAALFLTGWLAELDSYWCGLGAALAVMAVIRLAMLLFYRKNETYAQKVDVRYGDERNRFLAEKARSWTMYISILAAACGTIVFRALGQETYSTACGLFVAAMVVIYWVSYLILRRKY